MSVRIVTMGVGTPRTCVLDLAEELTISVSRNDGFAPSKPEVLAALEIALQGMKGKKKTRKRSAVPKETCQEKCV